MEHLSLEPDEAEKPKKKPPLSHRLYEAAERALGPAAPALAPVLFVVGWAFVNALFGSPDPESGYGWVWLAPSPEATAFFAVVAAWMTLRPARPPRLLTAPFILLMFPLWLLRLVDRLTQAAFGRSFHPVTDLAEGWELLILLDDTFDRFTIIAWCLASAIGVGLLFMLAHYALSHAATLFERLWPRFAFGATVAVLALAHLATGHGFAPSLVARAFGAVETPEAPLAQNPTGAEGPVAAPDTAGATVDLARLRQADVHVFVVPRYAQLLRDDPRFSPQLRARWDAFEAALTDARYHVRSTLISSNERLGLVEYEPASLTTGAPVASLGDLEAARARGVPTLAEHYTEAGYRTVHVLPAETRERPERDLRGFDTTYHSWELGYLGPAFGRSPMPDQYVCSFVRDRELWETEAPLLVLYRLSSSMPPFSPVPPYREAWSDVGRGDGYRTTPSPSASHTYFELAETADAYRASVLYVLDVLEGFLTVALDEAPPEGRGRESRRARRRRPAPLFVVVGDRPPLPPLSGPGPRGVLAHAISRRAQHLAPFADAGWSEGVVPSAQGSLASHAGLYTLLTRGLSTAADADP